MRELQSLGLDIGVYTDEGKSRFNARYKSKKKYSIWADLRVTRNLRYEED